MAGSGTQQDPFQVATYEDLCKVGTGIDNWNLDSYYIQTENIQCPTGENRHNFVPIGSYGNPFTGQYDGNNKTIKNLYIDRGDTNNIGLFGCASSGVLKNISLLNVNITGRYQCGALVGYITGAGLRVDSCNSSGIIYGTFGTVGGLIGAVSSGTEEDNTIIINSHSSVTVESEGERVGGFAGQFWTDVMVDNCYATGNVTGMGLIGGFVGIMSTANAIDCYATGEVEGGENTGGFAGKLQVSSTMENCYAIGNVTGTGLTGGFAGFISTTNAIDCYAEGEVEGGESTGGFVGQLQNSSIVENCYATGDVNGGERTGGFVGNFILESTATNCHTTNTVTGTQYIGGFAGFMSTNANSINCYAEGSVNSNGNLDTGGFVGFMSNANTIDCYAEGEVTGIECTGGFAGIMSSSANAINCYAEGEVTGTQYTGGFAGQLQNSSIVENCYTTGDVNGGKRTGGFVGNFISESTTTNCYATGAVEGGENTGGFAGIMFTANAINCYAEGSVNSNGNPDTGGFVGQLQISSTVENCYATGYVDGGERTGGFVGNVSSDSVVLYCFWDINTSGQIASAGGTGKTTAEMQSISTFADWNIVSIDNFNHETPTIWFIDDGNDYPRLGWEYVPEFAIKRFKVCVDNANRLVKTSKYGVNNVWRNIKEIKFGIANAWQLVWKRAVELIRTFTTKFTTKADFDTCTLTDTVATAAGDVELATTGNTGKKISSLPVGTKVRASNTKYNGEVIGFVVGHQASGRTKLITEKIITLKCFDAKEPSNPTSGDRRNYGNNRYSQSNIDQWLNSAAGAGAWYSARHDYDAPPNNANVYSNYNEYDAEAGFLSNFEEAFRNAILDTTIRVAKNTVTDGGGYEDIIRKVYLLSRTEVGLSNESGVAEGSKWDLFSNNNSRKAYPTAEAVSRSEYTSGSLNASSPWYWWLRTPYAGISDSARRVDTDGTLSYNNAYHGHRGVRPALELPNDIVVSETPDEDGYYTLDFSAGAYAQSGTAESPAIDLSPAIAAETSKIEFTTTKPTGTTVTVQTALSTDGGTNWGNWQTATSGAAIPGLAAGDDVSNTKMKWKATLSTNDVTVTPKLRNVIVKLNKGM